MLSVHVKLCTAAVQLTKVKRDVFPAPLGPIKRMDGRVVRPLARKINVWRRNGIVRARIIAITRPSGDGLIRATAQSFAVDMVARRADYYCDILVRKG